MDTNVVQTYGDKNVKPSLGKKKVNKKNKKKKK